MLRLVRRLNREEIEKSTVTQRHLNLEHTLVHWHTSNRVKTVSNYIVTVQAVLLV